MYKQLKQTYGLVKKSTTNLIDIKRLVIKDNVDESRPLCTFERAPSRRKNTTQPQQ